MASPKAYSERTADYPTTPKSASRRSSRRSWFDTPPVTSHDIAVEKQLPVKMAGHRNNKRRSMEDVETLVLSHFTKSPRIGFGKILVGRSKTRVLLVQNPAEYEQEVVLERFPHKRGFNVDQTHFVLQPEEVVTLTLTWTPQDAGGCREMVLFHVNEVYRLQAYLFGTADDPKPVKKGRKGMLGTRRKQQPPPPTSVVQTKSLNSIRDNYSPRKSEEIRELRSHIRPQNGRHVVADQENISPGDLDDPVPQTPPPLESTAICRSDEHHDQKAKERRKSGFISPTLSKMSPIPLMADNNNGCIMESYLSTTTTASAYHTPRHDGGNPNPGSKDADRSPLKNVTKNGNKGSGFPNDRHGERDRDRPETYRLVKTKKSYGRVVSGEGEKPKVTHEDRVRVSPSSFLNDSLAGRTMATTAAEVGRVCASYQVTRVADKATVSPNSFVQNLGNKQPGPPPPPPTTTTTTTYNSSIPSPSTVLNDSIPHNVVMKQLEHVRRSLHDGSFHESPALLTSAVQTQQSRPASKPHPLPARGADRLSQLAQPKRRNVFARAQQQESVVPSKKDKFLHRKLQDTARFAKITDVPSPRRKTFLITKKQQGRKASSPPQKTQPQGTRPRTKGAAPKPHLTACQSTSTGARNPTETSADVKKPNNTEKTKTAGRVDSRTVRKVSKENEAVFTVRSNVASVPGDCDEEELTLDDTMSNHRRSMWASPAVGGFVSPVIAVQSEGDSTGDERHILEALQAREKAAEEDQHLVSAQQNASATEETGNVPKTEDEGRRSSGRRLFPDVVNDDLNLSKDFKPLWSGSATVTKSRPSVSPPLSGSANSSKKLFPDIDSASTADADADAATTTPGVVALKSPPEALPQDMGEEEEEEEETERESGIRKVDVVDSAHTMDHSKKQLKPTAAAVAVAAAPVEIVDMSVAHTGPNPKRFNSFELHSPHQLPHSPASETGRRSTLTVTKPRPSQALLDACSNTAAAKQHLITDSQTVTPETKENTSDDLWQSETIVIETKNNAVVSLTVHREVLTPGELPTSPSSEHSRRSTHAVKNPVILNRDGMMPKNLFGSIPESRVLSGTGDMSPHERQTCEANDGRKSGESGNVSGKERNAAPWDEENVSPAMYVDRREQHVGYERDRVIRPAQRSMPLPTLDSSVSSQELSSDSLETEQKSSQNGQIVENIIRDGNHGEDCQQDCRPGGVAFSTGRSERCAYGNDHLVRENEDRASRGVKERQSSRSDTSLSRRHETRSVGLEKSQSHHVVTKNTSSTFLSSNEQRISVANKDREGSLSQENVTESFTEISPFPSATSVESRDCVFEISGQHSVDLPGPDSSLARETSAKPIVTCNVVKETLLKRESTAKMEKMTKSSSSSSSFSDQSKPPSSGHAWVIRSSSEDLSTMMPPPHTAKSSTVVKKTAASHHKAKPESLPSTRGQSLSKARSQGSLNRSKTMSQGSLDRAKTRSQGNLDRNKTRSQGSLGEGKWRSQECLDRSKAASVSQENLHSGKLMEQGRTEHGTDSLQAGQQKTPQASQPTERAVNRKRTSPEAGLRPPHSKRVELERSRADRRSQQTGGQGAGGSSRPRVGKAGKPARGVALSRLILVKKSKTALPKHPLPFAAKNMYYDERWQDKQERGFVHWLNFVLTPADEYMLATTKTKVDARTIAFDGASHQVAPRLAPTKEILSFRAYAARRRLNHLRRASCRLFQSEAVVRVVCRLELEVEQRRLAIRTDRMIHADIGLKQKILDLLLSYNPLWLRIGLETVYGEILPVPTNCDVIGMSHFVLTRLLTSPDISAHYAHPTVPHLYHDGYAGAVAQHMLKKFLVLVYFLDCAKQSRLITHDPCLFCKDAEVKSTKGLLIQFSRDFLSGEGDVTKHLAYMGYIVSHVQTPLDEFDYAVSNLCTDLRDGLRLGRIVMLLSGDWSFAPSLRSPAISRLQKIHNVELVLKQLTQRGLDLHTAKGGVLTARDIVEGHREKTLAFLWKLIFHFQAIATLNEQELQEEVAMLERTLRVKVCMQRMLGNPRDSLSAARRDSGGVSVGMDSPMLQLLLKWCRTVCLHYGVRVENFTVSFSDGRALCCLLHHYHPALLPLSSIRFRTSQSLQEAAENAEDKTGEDDSDLSQDWGTGNPLGGDLDQSLFETLLIHEKENFRVLYEKVSELGGIPLMLKAADMSNTIPDERVVITYLSYLCARLLDLREETRAARIIQLAWRRFCLHRSAHLRQKQSAAAVIIQRAWRQWRVAMTTRQQEAAAVRLQAMWRRRQALRRVALLRQAQRDSALHEAAATIQSCVRRFLTRQRFQRQIRSAVLIQSWVRALSARRAFLRHTQACRVIQTRFRAHTEGAAVRRQFAAQKHSAVVLQRAFRQRQLNRLENQNRAACVLQTVWRSRTCRREFLRHKEAAVCVQSWWRADQARQQFIKIKTACVIIQQRFRATSLGVQTRQDFLRLRQAALTLQKHVRGRQQRRRFRQSKTAALTIQKTFRGYRCRVRFQALQLATIIIQRAVRAHQARIAARQKFVAVREATVIVQRWFRHHTARRAVRREEAAVLIQAYVRGCRARKETNVLRAALRRESAAVMVQCAYRRYRAVQVFKGLQEAARREQAARTVQLAYRCHVIRKQLQLARRERAAVTVQSAYRRHCAIQQLRALQLQHRRHTAAVRLQSAVRTFLAAKKLQALRLAARREWAAVTIQSAYRSYAARLVLKALRLEAKKQTAARTIQTAYRRHLAVRELRRLQLQARQKEAAVTIQCAYRRHLAVGQLRALQEEACRQVAAAVKIQSAYRRYLAVTELRALQLAARREASAVRIQAAYRGHLARTYILTLKEAARQESAATKIQTLFRGHQQRRRYLTVRRAVLTIQTHLRGFLARKKYQETRELLLMLADYHQTQEKFQTVLKEYHQRWNAAVTVQSTWRGWQQWQKFQREKSSVCTLQAAVRGCIQKKRYHHLKASAIVIQRRFRAHRLGQAARLRYQLTLGAAVVIQSCWKMYVIRSYFLRLKAHVVCAQSQCRAFLARSRFQKQRQAALCLQRGFQAREARREYQKTRQAVIHLQALVRVKQGRERFCKQRQSCVRIQSAVRAWLAQRSYQNQRQSAVKLQRRWRAALQGRRDRERYRETRAALVTIQSFSRGYLVRQHVHHQKKAARQIQNCYRTHRTRQQFLRLRRAAVCIQGGVRLFLQARGEQRDLALRHQCCVKIQAAYRGHRARQTFLKRRRSVTTLQAGVRAWRQHRQYLALRRAVLLCQTHYRARCLGQVFRTAFLIIRQAAVVIQKHARGSGARRAYRRQRSSAVVIQSCVRGWLQRQWWKEQKRAVVCLQQRWRAKREGGVERESFLQTRRAVVTVQRAWRTRQLTLLQNTHRAATIIQKHVRRHLAQRRFRADRLKVVQTQALVRGYLARKAASERLHAVTVIQRRWQETLLAQQHRRHYLQTVRAAVIIQSVFRGRRCRVHFSTIVRHVVRLQAAVRGCLQRRKYLRLQHTVVTLQRRVRGNILCRQERKTFLQQRRSAACIQRTFRRWVKRRQERTAQAATRLQSYLRMLPVRRRYLRMKSAVITLQSALRARRARQVLGQRKAAVLLIQSRVRFFLLVQRLRLEVHRRQRAAMTVQKAFRNYVSVVRSERCRAAVSIQAAFRGYVQWRRYLRERRAALTLQCGVRGWRDRKRAREMRSKVKAAGMIQRGFRAWKLRKEEEVRRQQRAEYLQRYVCVAKRHLAVVRIQCWYRQAVWMRQAQHQLHSVIILQRRVRAFLHRVRFLRARQEAQELRERRQRAAGVIQRAFRKCRVQLEERRRLQLITRIQAIWRGRQLRRSLKSKKIAAARRRVQEANEKATEEKTLGHRTASALDFLLHYKQLAYILDALMHLDVATRLSWVCCERLVEVNAVGVIFRLILSCNRSLPHMELIKFSVSVLLNLAKYEKTTHAVYEAEDSVTTLVDLLSIYREKGGAIFTKTCMLLAILGTSPQRKAEMCGDKKLVAKLQSIHALVLRKHRMQVARARMVAARTCLNATLPSRLHGPQATRVRPAWVLRRDSVHDIEDPMAALSFLLDTLHIGPK